MARFAGLLDGEWLAAVDREGLASPSINIDAVSHGDEPPCPACGTAAPLIDGACSDCGLQLDDSPAACGKPGCGSSGGCG
jgi:hypothetical protein